MDAIILQEKPTQFQPLFEVVACYVECSGEILLLQRADHVRAPGKWGSPGGKIEQGEEKISALVRECEEELGCTFAPEAFQYVGTSYVTYLERSYLFHGFFLKLDKKPSIILDPKEHKAYAWVTMNNLCSLDMLPTDVHYLTQLYNLKTARGC